MFAALLYIAMAAAQTPGPEQLYDSAVQAQMRGDYDAAIRDYRSLIQQRPQMVEAHVNLGAALAHTGQFDAAIAEYKAALPLMQDKTGVLFNIGLAYYKKSDWKGVRETFAPLAKLQPRDLRIAMLLGYAELKLDDGASAAALLAPFADANSENPDFDFVYASALVQTGKRRDGIERAEKAAKLSNGVDAWVLAGTALMQVNEYERARGDLDKALTLDPNLPAAIYSMDGVARDKSGQPELAEASFREALKRDPNDFDSNLYLGAILLKRRELEPARPYLANAIRIDPKSSMARYEDAMLKSTARDYQPAVDELEKLVKDDPQWLEPHVELASLYYKLHRPDDGAKERAIVDRITAEQQKKGPQ